jgi:hypothetical protein
LKNSKNEFKLNPEDKLILSCGHSQVNDDLEKKIKKLVNLDLDWKYILDMATRHRLRPLLYYNLNRICPDKVPDDVLISLREFYHSNVRKNLMMTGELVKVMKLLEEKGVNAVTYKGPVLAQMAYGNVGLREFGDLDILVDKSDALKVIEIMAQTDYELYPAINIEDSFYLRFVTEHQFVHRDSGVIIEIKWKFAGDFFTFPEDSSFLTNDIINTDLNGFKVNNFSPDNQLLILAIHAGKHDWARISWIMDIANYIKKHPVNWEYCMNKAEKLGVRKILLINLYLAWDLWGLELPNNILNQIDSDKSIEKISYQIEKRFFQKKDLNIFGKLSYNLKKRDKLIYGIKDSVNGLTKPGYRDFTDIPLPESFFRFYHFLRPFLLLKRYGKEPV